MEGADCRLGDDTHEAKERSLCASTRTHHFHFLAQRLQFVLLRGELVACSRQLVGELADLLRRHHRTREKERRRDRVRRVMVERGTRMVVMHAGMRKIKNAISLKSGRRFRSSCLIVRRTLIVNDPLFASQNCKDMSGRGVVMACPRCPMAPTPVGADAGEDVQ